MFTILIAMAAIFYIYLSKFKELYIYKTEFYVNCTLINLIAKIIKPLLISREKLK